MTHHVNNVYEPSSTENIGFHRNKKLEKKLSKPKKQSRKPNSRKKQKQNKKKTKRKQHANKKNKKKNNNNNNFKKNWGKCRFCCFCFLFFFLVTLPVELLFWWLCFWLCFFNVFYVLLKYAEINFLCSTRGHKTMFQDDIQPRFGISLGKTQHQSWQRTSGCIALCTKLCMRSWSKCHQPGWLKSLNVLPPQAPFKTIHDHPWTLSIHQLSSTIGAQND